MQSLVFAGRKSGFLLEYLAKIGGGIKSALEGDLGHGEVASLQQITCRTDFDGVEIGDEGNAHLIREGAAEIGF